MNARQLEVFRDKQLGLLRVGASAPPWPSCPDATDDAFNKIVQANRRVPGMGHTVSSGVIIHPSSNG